MKHIFKILLCIIALFVIYNEVNAQHNPPQKIPSWYEFTAVTNDSALILPTVQTPLYYRRTGALYWSTSDSNVYVWTGSQFLCMTCGRSNTWPQTLANGRTFSASDSALLGTNQFYFKNGTVKNDKLLFKSDSNINAKIVMPVPDDSNSNFSTSITGFAVNPLFGRPYNWVTSIGWNVDHAHPVSRDGVFRIGMENNFQNVNVGSHPTTEFHVETTLLDGTIVRNISILQGKDSLFGGMLLQNQAVQMNTNDNLRTYASFSDNTCDINPRSSRQLDNVAGVIDLTIYDSTGSIKEGGFKISGQSQGGNPSLGLNRITYEGYDVDLRSNGGFFFNSLNPHGTGNTDFAFSSPDAATSNLLFIGKGFESTNHSAILIPANLHILLGNSGGDAGSAVQITGSQSITDDQAVAPGNGSKLALDVTSTTRAFAPPRMTTTQKNAISSPVEGSIVYDLTLHKLCVFTGSVWETITSL